MDGFLNGNNLNSEREDWFPLYWLTYLFHKGLT